MSKKVAELQIGDAIEMAGERYTVAGAPYTAWGQTRVLLRRDNGSTAVMTSPGPAFTVNTVG